MSFTKFLLEEEEKKQSEELQDKMQKVTEYLKNVEREDITDEDIHNIANELEMEPSEVEIYIYQLAWDKVHENDENMENSEEENSEHENMETPEDEDLEHQKECKDSKVKNFVMNDSKVMESFLKKLPMSGNKLQSTGRELKFIGENVIVLAKWDNSKILVLDEFVNLEISKITKVLKENSSYCKTLSINSFGKILTEAIRKFNRKEYNYYLIRNGKIVQGFKYKEDGQDLIKDEPDYVKGGKLCAKSMLKSKGLDPENNNDWKE